MPRRANITKPSIKRSGGNADGLTNAPEKRAKVQLAAEINRILDERKLTQAAAAKILGTGQPKVSALRNYRLSGFSLERLMRFTKTLGHDVDVVSLPPAPAGRSKSGAAPSGIIPGKAKTPREKWAALKEMIEEWMKDESGYDERVWPELLRNLNANRMSYRSRG